MLFEPKNPAKPLLLSGVDCRRGTDVLINKVNLTLEPGTVTGLIGPNGAGKSTLIATLLGDIAPATGTVTYGGVPVRSLPHRAGVFGVVTESHGLPKSMTVGSVIEYWASVHDSAKHWVDDYVSFLEVRPFTDKKIKKLSTGMRRRVEIVLSVLSHPDVLILDEPFNGLDVHTVKVVRSVVNQWRDNGKIVLLSTHTLSELDTLADRMTAVHNGQLVELDFKKGQPGASEAAYLRLQEGE